MRSATREGGPGAGPGRAPPAAPPRSGAAPGRRLPRPAAAAGGERAASPGRAPEAEARTRGAGSAFQEAWWRQAPCVRWLEGSGQPVRVWALGLDARCCHQHVPEGGFKAVSARPPCTSFAGSFPKQNNAGEGRGDAPRLSGGKNWEGARPACQVPWVRAAAMRSSQPGQQICQLRSLYAADAFTYQLSTGRSFYL